MGADRSLSLGQHGCDWRVSDLPSQTEQSLERGRFQYELPMGKLMMMFSRRYCNWYFQPNNKRRAIRNPGKETT